MKRIQEIHGMMGGVVQRVPASPIYGKSMFDLSTLRREFRPIGGGADDEQHFEHLPEEVVAQLQDMGSLDDKALKDLEAKLVKDLQATRKGELDDDTILLMTEMADAVKVVRGEAEARIAQATELENKADELLKAVLPEEPEAEAEGTEGETEGNTEGTESDEGDGGNVTNIDKAEEVNVEGEGETAEPEAVAAAAAPVRPTPGQAARAIPKNRRARPRKAEGLAIVAAGDVPGFSAGMPMSGLEDVGQAFFSKSRSGVKGRALVASIKTPLPADRVLGQDADQNESIIASVTSPKALAAAGGICAPVNTDDGGEVLGTQDRPIRDALARFNADQGGIRYIPPLTLSEASGAVGVWDNDRDSNPGNATKPCLVVECDDETTVYVQAITKCLQAGNFLRKFSPRRFQNFWDLAGVAHARTAEDELWDAMVAASTAVTAGQTLGTSRDVLTALDRAAAAIRSHHRVSPNAPLRWMAPFWIKDQIRADLARQLPGDNTLAVADAQVDAFFNVRNINVTWSLDATQVLASEGGAALQGWPSTFESLLFPEGTFVHLDGGQLDFGMEIRDSSLNSQNNVQAFMETFEAVAKRGPESYVITHDTCPSGEASGTTDITPTICTTGS